MCIFTRCCRWLHARTQTVKFQQQLGKIPNVRKHEPRLKTEAKKVQKNHRSWRVRVRNLAKLPTGCECHYGLSTLKVVTWFNVLKKLFWRFKTFTQKHGRMRSHRQWLSLLCFRQNIKEILMLGIDEVFSWSLNHRQQRDYTCTCIFIFDIQVCKVYACKSTLKLVFKQVPMVL